MELIFDEEMLNAAINALKNEFFLKGESVKKFEEDFKNYIGTKHALALNSGTTALHLSLLAFGIGKNNYVITTPATFIATANAITYTGAYPLFVDITLNDYNINPVKIEEAIKQHKDKVKAIMPVHLYGYPSKMDEINELASEHDLCVIEDSCQSHGGSYKGKKLGSIGDTGTFSFYPSKNMTVAGDGGMLTTNSDEVADHVSQLRDCGRSKTKAGIHDYIGYTARLNTVNAAIGRVQLKHLDKWVQQRKKTVKRYHEELDDIEGLVLPPKDNNDCQSAWHLFVVRVKDRMKLKEFLFKEGIRTSIHYDLPVHLHPPYLKMDYKETMFPNAEIWAKEVLTIPLHSKLTEENITFITQKIKKFFKT